MTRRDLRLIPVLLLMITGIYSCGPESEFMPITTSSEEALTLYKEGVVYFDQLKLEKSWDNFAKAVELDPEFFMAHFWMYFITKDNSKNYAEKAFKTRSKLSKGEEELKMALKYLVEGDSKKTILHLNTLVELHPHDPQPYKTLYTIQLHLLKEGESAFHTMEDAIKNCPKYGPAYNQIAYVYMERKMFDEAEEALDMYLVLCPNEANPYDSKGDFYMRTGNYEEALESYTWAWETDSDFIISKKKAEKARSYMERTESGDE